jgi:hypothetical protein
MSVSDRTQAAKPTLTGFWRIFTSLASRVCQVSETSSMSENKCRRQEKQNDFESSEHAFRVSSDEFWDFISWTMMSIISCGKSGDFRTFLASIRFEGVLALEAELGVCRPNA